MRLRHLVARGFRNLADLDREFPADGVALLGANGQGKTNLLEAIYYPVLFRSLRGADDLELAQVGGPGFHVAVGLENSGPAQVAATWTGLRRKRIAIDGEPVARLTEAVGRWLAVAFLPEDVGLAAGPASERRRYLDRVLSLSSRGYLRSLARYREGLAQRNAALRQGRAEIARMFEPVLAAEGARVIGARLDWVARVGEEFAEESDRLGEPLQARLRYAGRSDLAAPDAWFAVLEATLARDLARGATGVGPHRDDLILELGGRPLRAYGSTGQQRTAAVALKLLEVRWLSRARGTEPVLLLDDVFAELDAERQACLARQVTRAGRQVFVTAPRADELPAGLDLPVLTIAEGRLR